ncbi:MAG: patatin-like phospholipase family protein [Anaerolineales bacterium]|nr:patatin-like phospholipase family protein [Anaerolineales bacterium]
MDITLALGGGGAKGIAHLGVLRCLLKAGFQIRALAGTSAGGMIGSLYAAGYGPDEILERFLQVDQSNLYHRMPGDGPSILGVAGINRVLGEMLGERTFDELRIPFAVSAVDFKTGREVILKHGRVLDAVLATIAVPGIFPPQEWENYTLVDGGLLNPVPVAPARALAPRLPVAAVALNGPQLHPIETFEPPSLLQHVPLLRQIAQLRLAQAFSVFLRSLEIGSLAITEMRLQLDQPDVIIRPDLEGIGLLDRVDLADVTDRGERAAELALSELQASQAWQRKLKRWWAYGGKAG